MAAVSLEMRLIALPYVFGSANYRFVGPFKGEVTPKLFPRIDIRQPMVVPSVLGEISHWCGRDFAVSEVFLEAHGSSLST